MYVLLSIVWHTEAVVATCNGKQCMKYTHAAASCTCRHTVVACDPDGLGDYG